MIHGFLWMEPLDSLLAGFLMNSSSRYILEESFDILLIDVGSGSAVFMDGVAVPTRIAPTIFGRQLRNETNTWTMCWIFR